MTVEELILRLQSCPPRAMVVARCHSSYSEVVDVESRELRPRGGYMSEPYGQEDHLFKQTCIYLGV